MFEMFYGNGWSFLWMICPIANIVVYIKYIIRMCHSFGWYGAKVLIAFFFAPIAIILFAFGGDPYRGPNGNK